jgi:multicomponent Na+:H+ antiporter subunit D
VCDQTGDVKFATVAGLSTGLQFETAVATLAVLYLVPALSLAGIPPLSGFLAKLGLIQAGTADGGMLALIGVGAAILTSLLTLYAMGKVWSSVFWGPIAPVVQDVDPTDAIDVGTARTPRLLVDGAPRAECAVQVDVLLRQAAHGLEAVWWQKALV